MCRRYCRRLRRSERFLQLVVFGFGGMLAGEVGAAGFFGGLELHEFDASQVGVVEVELNLAVAPHLGLGAVGTLAVVGSEGLDCVAHVGDAEGEVIDAAVLLQAGIGALYFRGGIY
jgi:hypothetical protein